MEGADSPLPRANERKGGEDEFRNLVNPEQRGGKHRRRILELIGKEPGISPYDLTKKIFGKPVNEKYASLRYHLDKLERVDVVKEFGERPHKLVLTEKGKDLCVSEGIKAVYKRRGGFIRVLNQWLLARPLSHGQILNLKAILTDRVLATLLEIGRRHPLPLPTELQTDYDGVNPEVDAWCVLRGAWIYQIQRKLDELSDFTSRFVNGSDIESWKVSDGVKTVEEREVKEGVDRFVIFLENQIQHNPKLSRHQNVVKIAFPCA